MSNLKPNSDVLSGNSSPELQPLLDNLDLEKSFETKKEITMKRKNTYDAGEMVDILRENAYIREERYETKQSSGHDDVELFYLNMAKIAKRLPIEKQAKLRMEVCNMVSETELAHLLEVEVESFNQQNAASNQSQILTHPVFSNNQNQPVHFQPQNLCLHEEQSEDSWPTSPLSQAYVNENQRDYHPILNRYFHLSHQPPNDNVPKKSSSNQYES